MDVATPSILDFADLLNRVDDDRELLAELFQIFRSLFPVHLQRLSEAVTQGAAKGVQTESHALKGMLLNLSAARAASVAAQLERMGLDQNLEGMPQALVNFRAEVNLLLARMDEYSNELKS